jgi:hypothetical protein
LKKGVQTAICCPCGNEKILALGLCATCYTLNGRMPSISGACESRFWSAMDTLRVCGDPNLASTIVSGRVCSSSDDRSLCGVSAKVHRTKVVLTELSPLLLWREQHPEGHEQRYIDFNVRKPAA